MKRISSCRKVFDSSLPLSIECESRATNYATRPTKLEARTYVAESVSSMCATCKHLRSIRGNRRPAQHSVEIERTYRKQLKSCRICSCVVVFSLSLAKSHVWPCGQVHGTSDSRLTWKITLVAFATQ